jgi:predicted enzyme related to lactoylglutathione lyase
MIQAVWVEIPVKDLERAKAFYEAVFKLDPVEISDEGVRRTATLFWDSGDGRSPGISLNQTANFEPSDKGTLVYLNTDENINAVLPRVEAAGGRVTAPRTAMGDAGNYALVLDTEGNTLCLYDNIKD